MILWLWWALEFEELQFTWFWGLLERGSQMAWNLTTCLFDLEVWRYVTLQHCYAPWFFRQEDDEYWFRYTCPVHDPKTDVHYYNDLASLYFAIPSQVPTIPLQNGVMVSYSKFEKTNISACVPPEILNFKSYQVCQSRALNCQRSIFLTKTQYIHHHIDENILWEKNKRSALFSIIWLWTPCSVWAVVC